MLFRSDRVAVMYAGRVVEEGPVAALLAAPAHPYTRGLIDSMPDLDREADRLPSIPGSVPDLANLPAGCAFAPRCTRADARCATDVPTWATFGSTHRARCWKPLVEANA